MGDKLHASQPVATCYSPLGIRALARTDRGPLSRTMGNDTAVVVLAAVIEEAKINTEATHIRRQIQPPEFNKTSRY
jgi:hypothetical protein